MRVILGLAVSVTLAAVSPGFALDINVGDIGVSIGGGDNGGVSASVSVGDTSVGASAGGGGGTAASVSTRGSAANAAVAGNGGPLVSAGQANGSTSARIDIGSLLANPGSPRLTELLSGIDTRTALLTPGAANGPAEQFRREFQSMPFAEQRKARATCKTLLANPASADRRVLALCILIARL